MLLSTNIFEQATEFVDLDPRRLRDSQPVSTDSLYKRLKVQIALDDITDKTMLDLGSALGGAGHYALTHGCKHYTGVDAQNYYIETSNQSLSKYWTEDKFTIVHQDIEEFLDCAISQGLKWDFVLASGMLYGFLNPVDILAKIASVATETIVIDSLSTGDDRFPGHGLMMITRQSPINYAKDKDTVKPAIVGAGSRFSINALNIILETHSFGNAGRLYPEPIVGVHDPYNTKEMLMSGQLSAMRYIVKYRRLPKKPSTYTIQETLLGGATVNFKENSWTFDQSVADRFQDEAVKHIPSYHAVIDKCVAFAESYLNKDDRIIDVGSALGYTIQRFVDAGFTNVVGVDNSEAMIASSYRPDLITLSDKLPTDKYRLVIANWTLHFVKDKVAYFQDIYDCLEPGGYLILTDKTIQTATGKQLYYDFKRKNGVSEEYIVAKEQQLKGIMHSMPVEWYLDKLRLTKFSTSDIIHSDLGFVTFLCVK